MKPALIFAAQFAIIDVAASFTLEVLQLSVQGVRWVLFLYGIVSGYYLCVLLIGLIAYAVLRASSGLQSRLSRFVVSSLTSAAVAGIYIWKQGFEDVNFNQILVATCAILLWAFLIFWRGASLKVEVPKVGVFDAK
jgi:hypothetical protein